jgi:predicted RNA methylase
MKPTGKPDSGQKANANPAIFGELFASATNAPEKGSAQWFTPAKWAKLFALPLPDHRPAIVDLTCGRGDLLKGAANDSTEHRLGCDIDPDAGRAATSGRAVDRSESGPHLSADLTALYPLLREVGFEADLFTLNPPWDLHWHRSRLQGLSKSALATVRHAFAAHDGRTRKDTIDSSVATLCLALDLCSDLGEGYLLTNLSTAHRLILDQGAPHEALRDHIWAVVELPANEGRAATSGRADGPAPVPSCLLYFAKDHLSGPGRSRGNETQIKTSSSDQSLLTSSPTIFETLRRERVTLREGCEVRSYRGSFTEDTATLWRAAAEEWQRLTPQTSPLTPRFNLWLDHSGHVGAYVSLFDTRAGKVSKDEAALLDSLAGKRPLQLVVQRAQRDALKRAAGILPAESGSSGSPWRVDPDLQQAVVDAIRDYNAARAPLYPLPAIQRLGYLDEEDFIEVRNERAEGRAADHASHLSPLSSHFLPRKRYPITTQTLAVRRQSQRVNLAGEKEDLELTGQELAIFIESEQGERLCFMEQRLLHEDVRIERPGAPGSRPARSSNAGQEPGAPKKKSSLPDDGFAPSAEVIHFTLQQLVDVFIVPEVPDVAAVNPEGYQRNLELLQQIESLCQ